MFVLRFEKSLIVEIASRYPVDEDREIETLIAPQVRDRRYFTKAEFQTLCGWKTQRSKPLLETIPRTSLKRSPELPYQPRMSAYELKF